MPQHDTIERWIGIVTKHGGETCIILIVRLYIDKD
jgi:hypothetical protein